MGLRAGAAYWVLQTARVCDVANRQYVVRAGSSAVRGARIWENAEIVDNCCTKCRMCSKTVHIGQKPADHSLGYASIASMTRHCNPQTPVGDFTGPERRRCSGVRSDSAHADRADERHVHESLGSHAMPSAQPFVNPSRRFRLSRDDSQRCEEPPAKHDVLPRLIAAAGIVICLVAALYGALCLQPSDGRNAAIGVVHSWDCGVTGVRSVRPRGGITASATLAHSQLVADPGTSSTHSAPCTSRMIWPVSTVRSPSQVTRRFDAPAQPWLPGHRGVDLPVTSGIEFIAPQDATVRFAGRVAGKDVVSLMLDSGLISTFEPARTRLSMGTRVQRGDVVGTVEGESDHCGDSCLHWGVRAARNDYRDPAFYVGMRLIGLKPDGDTS